MADPHTLQTLETNRQIVFRYSNKDGQVLDSANPNGSIGNIAGVTNKAGNVVGLMPHPEHAVDSVFGSDDGRKLFNSILL